MSLPYTILLDTVYGRMLVNRHDINQTNALLKTGAAIDKDQVRLAEYFCRVAPEKSVMLDIGANFGTYALACGRVLEGRAGAVHAFEGQRILANMICGSVALNAIENLFVHNVCVGNSSADVPLPKFDYASQMNFGSVEFGPRQREPLHQTRGTAVETVRQVRMDDLGLSGVCFVKIDVEGMEESVIDGARETFERCRPAALIEYIKSHPHEIARRLSQRDYEVYVLGGDFLCLPAGKTFEGLRIDLPRYSNSMVLKNHVLTSP